MNTIRLFAIPAVAALAVSLAMGSAHATPLSYTFSGEITGFDAASAASGGLGPIAIGDSFSGSFTYDPDATLITGGSGVSVYNAVSHIEAGVHGLTLSSNTRPGWSDFTVADGSPDSLAIDTFPGDWLNALTYNTGSTFACFGMSCLPYYQRLDLIDVSGQAFGSEALPAALNLASFTSGTFYFNWLTSFSLNQVYAGGALTSLKRVGDEELPRSVPEPATLMLCLAGLLAAGLVRARTGPSASSVFGS